MRDTSTSSRNYLVGQHIGETEAKTAAVLANAAGRALFIDEAGDLYKPDRTATSAAAPWTPS